MLFDKCKNEFVQINLLDFARWQIESKNQKRISTELIRKYLDTKHFQGEVQVLKNNFVILDNGNLVKIVKGKNITKLLDFLQLQANTITIDFKGYTAKSYLPPRVAVNV